MTGGTTKTTRAMLSSLSVSPEACAGLRTGVVLAPWRVVGQGQRAASVRARRPVGTAGAWPGHSAARMYARCSLTSPTTPQGASTTPCWTTCTRIRAQLEPSESLKCRRERRHWAEGGCSIYHYNALNSSRHNDHRRLLAACQRAYRSSFLSILPGPDPLTATSALLPLLTAAFVADPTARDATRTALYCRPAVYCRTGRSTAPRRCTPPNCCSRWPGSRTRPCSRAGATARRRSWTPPGGAAGGFII